MRATKLSLLGAVALLSFIARGASADDAITFDYGGYANLSGYGLDQDEVAGNDINDYDFAADARVWGRARHIFDNGIEAGLRGQLRFRSSEAKFSDDHIRGAPQVIDEVMAYVQTAFGRVAIGLDDGAADSSGLFAPVVSEANRIDDAKHYVVRDPLRADYSPFTPNGAHLRTDVSSSGDAMKIMYYSPRLFGVQISASYAPELTRGFNDLFESDDLVDRQSNIWEVGLSYQASLAGFDVGAYGSYLSGSNEDATSGRTVTFGVNRLNSTLFNVTSDPFTTDDIEEYGTGVIVAYENLKVGGSWRHTNVAGGGQLQDRDVSGPASSGCAVLAGCVLPNANTEIYSVGATYETGPWTFGVSYAWLDEELPSYTDTTTGPAIVRHLTQEAEAWHAGVGYEVGDGVDLYAGYQHYNFDGPAGVCTSVACDTLEADVFYLQTAFSF